MTEVTSPEGPEGPEQAGPEGDAPAESPASGVVGVSRDPSPARPSRGRLRLRSRRELVLAVVAALGLIGTLVFGVAWGNASGRNDASDQAKATARNFLIALTNFDGKSIDADVRRIATYASGAFAQQLTQFFGPDVRTALKENQASSRGEIKDLFVQSNSGGQVRVYTVVDQTIANLHIPTPQADELRIELGLTRVKGAWRVFDVRVLEGRAAGLSGGQPDSGSSTTQPATSTPTSGP
jgi:Mce-associated membrane protein